LFLVVIIFSAPFFLWPFVSSGWFGQETRVLDRVYKSPVARLNRHVATVELEREVMALGLALQRQKQRIEKIMEIYTRLRAANLSRG